MRVYIAGPMTGYADYNVLAFNQAHTLLSNLGHEAVTPFDANSRVWMRHFGRPFNPATDKCDYGDPILKEMIAEDNAELCSCDAIALLPGWEKSKGTRVELLLALNLRHAVLDATTGKERRVSLSLDPWATWAADEAPPYVRRGCIPPSIGEFVNAAIPLTRGKDGVLRRHVQQDLFENSYDG